jgi:hypothetical protein
MEHNPIFVDILHRLGWRIIHLLNRSISSISDFIPCKNSYDLYFNLSHYNDLNDMVQLLVTDDSKSFHGKKLIANGNESLSFTDVDNLIKQTYSSNKENTEANNLLRKIFFNWQLFFNGNTHVTNMNFMLHFLQNRNPQFSGNENAAQALGLKTKSFREYYSQKAEKFDDRIDSKADDLLKNEEPSDFRFPKLQNYWNLSLD